MSIQCDAAALARVAHEQGVESISTRQISERIRELGAAQDLLAQKSARLREVTSTVDAVNKALTRDAAERDIKPRVPVSSGGNQ